MNYQAEISEAKEMIAEWYAEGTMWGEAQAQRMESWLECDPEDLNWDDLLSDTTGDTLYWLESMMGDCSPDELKPGGLYHWMVQAYEQGSC